MTAAMQVISKWVVARSEIKQGVAPKAQNAKESYLRPKNRVALNSQVLYTKFQLNLNG